jgi:DNA-binding GntR family transcriptional regulator
VSDQPGVRKTRKALLHEQVASTLREAIVKGYFRPGQRLIEEELASQLGVSRLPLGRAFAQLVSEGLLQKVNHRGTFVVELSAKDLRESYSLRCALEMLAVETLIDTCTAEKLGELRSLVQEMEQLAAAEDNWHLVDVEMRFHSALCRLSGNSRLYAAWSVIYSQLQCFFATDFRYQQDPHVASGHQHIVDCIAAGDKPAATSAVREHIQTSAERVLSFLSTRTDPLPPKLPPP